MTQQDDITQRVLTDDEILTATLYGQSEARMIRNGRAIESALLSKLRAPVADERAVETFAERFALALTPVAYTTKRGAVYRGKSTQVGSENLCTISQAVYEFRAALASAPVAAEHLDGLRTLLAQLPGMREDPRKGDAVFRCGVNGALDVVEGRIRELLRSAPVAGEALDTLTIILEWNDGKSDEIEVHGTEKMLRRLQVWLDRKRGLFHDAAPQASPSDDKLWDQTMGERDEYHDMADKLANAIADHLLVEIGEHTSSNCPWMRALEAIENAAPQAGAEPVRDVNAAMAAEYQRWIDWFHKGRDYDSFLKECVFNKPQADKDGGQQLRWRVTDDMRYAVRFAPSSAHWSERLKEFFGPDAREGIDALERQLREARAILDSQERAGDAVRDALWTLTEHNALHFGEQHSTVIQGRAALSATQGATDAN